MINPIKPDAVTKLGTPDEIPDDVISVVNKLVENHWDGSRSKIYQDKIVEEINKTRACPLNLSVDAKILNFENLYRNEGWIVEYIKPAYNQTGPSFFVFSKPEKAV